MVFYYEDKFRQLGQYEDQELDGLYYNRFRYYDSNTGTYISQDPIRLAGNNPNFYAYTFDSNSEVDVFGLHLNSNSAVGNFGIYEIKIDGELYKIGKADLARITQSSGNPTRLHQQLRKLQEIHPDKVISGEVVQKGLKTTLEAKSIETARLQAHFDTTGEVPEGNKKSFKPKTDCK
ncbi:MULTISPECIES: RHS repeat-associated core domain-containing protein [unclassified Gilliamella]|uniref:RHS repeat-associated core domain-containing protein n=1 Tax=unclassified Gilliamella TaxID=2685620 RepID=UPI001305CB65|nr:MULTISPECIES: RHS repeat-associated core domain-containing protein [unclassified Gilliamella]MWP50273.1 RHS repeat-associated core domain-containing protein [Gilliamella sp. Lep-s35]MWP69619.1 RHS repeat-associated core domain-containing protein [Gilliamella sp. Lep-s5]MWP77890.1 RHS repeat-associated core domain-containing protein [Gilliamella sp. Lep-s21]